MLCLSLGLRGTATLQALRRCARENQRDVRDEVASKWLPAKLLSEAMARQRLTDPICREQPSWRSHVPRREVVKALPKRPSEAGCEQLLKKNRCAGRRKPTVESTPRDEIRKKIAPWWVSAKKCGGENYTGLWANRRGAGHCELRWRSSCGIMPGKTLSPTGLKRGTC